jgi:hypothetical protein
MTKLFLTFFLINTCFSSLLLGSVDIRWDGAQHAWIDQRQEGVAPESVRTIRWHVDFIFYLLPVLCTKKLSIYPNTSTLDFSNYFFLDEDAERFFIQGTQYPGITNLDISGNRNGLLDRAESIADMLSLFPNLAHFTFRQSLHFPCSAVFSALADKPNLQTLIIQRGSDVADTNEENNWDYFIASSSSLKKLQVSPRLNMNFKKWSAFCQALGQSKLTALKLAIPRIEEDEIERTADVLLQDGVLPLHTLTSLQLGSLPSSPACIESITHILKTASLTSVGLQFQNGLPEESAQCIIAALGDNQTVTELDLAHNKLTEQALAGLSQALTRRTVAYPLKKLHIDCNAFSAYPFLIEALKHGNSFQEVSIKKNAKSTELIENLATCNAPGGINKLCVTDLEVDRVMSAVDKQKVTGSRIPNIEWHFYDKDADIVANLEEREEKSSIMRLSHFINTLYFFSPKNLYPRFELKGTFQIDSENWHCFKALRNRFEWASNQPSIQGGQARFLAIIALLAKL